MIGSMRATAWPLAVVLGAALVMTAAAQRAGQSVSVQYGVVTSAR